MKVFQRKAAITRGEIAQHNSELNVKYGLADEKSQEYFDDEGKLRWNENLPGDKTIFWYLEPEK